MTEAFETALTALRVGDVETAERMARLALAAGEGRAHGLLAAALQSRGALADALAHAEAAIAQAPAVARAHARAGSIALALGRPTAAAGHLEAAMKRGAGEPALFNDYAMALAGCGRLADAEAALRRAAAMAPDVPEIRNNLGNVLKARGCLQAAELAYAAALQLRPDYAEALNNLGVVRQLAADIDGAIGAYGRALACKPDYAEAHTHYGTALAAKGEIAAAEAAHRRALALAPDLADAHNNLAIVLKDMGRFAAAAAEYRAALDLRPEDAATHSNLLLCLNYDPAVDGRALLGAHRQWARRHEKGPPLATFRPAGRPLRIGYVSPDFREHSVAAFIDPVLTCHDPERVLVHCYSDVVLPDATTARLAGLVPRWRETAGMSDDALAQLVAADRIDLLIDLAGHTAHNRLPLFARRAAPRQATWIGYPATTGLGRIDYRLTDAVADPTGSEGRHSERLLRLPGCFLCFGPQEEAPPLPQDITNGRPTVFGSFNNLSKLSPQTVQLWARVLSSVSDARLLLKSRQLADAALRARVAEMFAACGVEAGRLDFRARTPDRAAHLALYGEVDVALDTTPYNGATTTCEALWMGVPVVTLAGRLHAGRVGASLLAAAGRPGWVATDADAFVAVASALAAARPGRAALRAEVAASPLCAAAAFTRGLEDLLLDAVGAER